MLWYSTFTFTPGNWISLILNNLIKYYTAWYDYCYRCHDEWQATFPITLVCLSPEECCYLEPFFLWMHVAKCEMSAKMTFFETHYFLCLHLFSIFATFHSSQNITNCGFSTCFSCPFITFKWKSRKFWRKHLKFHKDSSLHKFYTRLQKFDFSYF